MNFFKRIAILFYVTLVLFLAVGILLFVSHGWNYQNVSEVIGFIYYDELLRWIFGGLAVVLLIKNFVFYRFFSKSTKKERIIAFDNPSGRVSVSIQVLEDIVKRSSIKIPEVKDVKSTICPTKKGLEIKIRLTLNADQSIPQITAKVQDIVRKRIADAIGLDDEINVSIFVGKVVQGQKLTSMEDNSNGEHSEEDPQVPFHGYRA
jgi:uncharacterized alkaline shock family protein YloU